MKTNVYKTDKLIKRLFMLLVFFFFFLIFCVSVIVVGHGQMSKILNHLFV